MFQKDHSGRRKVDEIEVIKHRVEKLVGISLVPKKATGRRCLLEGRLW